MVKLRYLFFILVLLPSGLQAQSWCTPEAEWTYRLTQFGTDFERRYRYDSDVNIGGQNLQRISTRDSTLIGGFPGVQTGYFYTTKIGDVVLSRTWNSPYWDTLYYYGSPGERWWPNGAPDASCVGYYGMIQIQDTCSIFIAGQHRKKWELSHLDEDGTAYPGFWDMVEGVGTVPFQINPWYCSTIVEWYWWEFLSYSDIHGSFDSWPTWENCGISTEIAPVPLGPEFTLYPNPGTRSLNISGSSTDNCRVTIRDNSGKSVLESTLGVQAKMINTEKLVPGIYQVAIQNWNGATVVHSWSKVDE